ncbi:sensor histidine kinase [Lachnospiraceae bacterium]|nr:sensor histidine kinase [Lachnospiraceae bacterium]
MKSKKKLNPFLRIFLLVSLLFVIAVIAVIAIFYYIFGITEPEGLSLASWPRTFTTSFAVWMENDNGRIKIEEMGLERLDEYGLWIQVIDETGCEVFSHSKPGYYPAYYSASELIALSTSAYSQGNTIFADSFKDSGRTWSYLIGFPYPIGKHMLYYNGGNVGRLFPVLRISIFILIWAIVLFLICYGFWLTRHLGKITNGIGGVSQRSYVPLPEKGVFSQIYGALNQMDREVRHSDEVRQSTERARKEWIANITHDLKTPLSPIKGYAELLTANPAPDRKLIQEYSGIILKNVNYTEKMISDLTLTYQLDSGAVPYHPQAVRLVRFLKELVIDIVNNPAFAGRDIEFAGNMPETKVCLDPDLFRRAVNNLIINALTHNLPDTKVTVSIGAGEKKELFICISDNGTGMKDEEKAVLFQRYYRGTSTKEKPEGSGLGLAIAKQIITLHGGDITVSSKPGAGTRFTIFIPTANEENSHACRDV